MAIQIGGIKLYGVDDLHKAFGLNKRTIRHYFISGKFKGRKVGTKWFITEENLNQYLSGQDTEISPEKKEVRLKIKIKSILIASEGCFLPLPLVCMCIYSMHSFCKI